MGIIEYFKPGTLLGSVTAGANEDINFFRTMGGFVFVWTGAKVLQHNYKQFHLIGVKPSIEIKPTIEGVKNGIDEF